MDAAMRVAFGEFTYDSALRELSSRGQRVHLSPKAFQLLGYLLANRPRALAKEDLYAHLWPDTFVEEANLKNLVVEVRSALGDDRRAPRFIKTIYGYGYSFIGGVTAGDETGNCFLRYFSRHLPLIEGENVLGRDPTCTPIIDELDVSRYHARITVSGDTATIEDLGSKNGTFVAGVKITGPAPLAPGSEIRLGETPLTFHRRDALQSTRSASFGKRRP
jgi:DNA-binding winged helix-turn-helix (wHTH) protein